MTDTIVKHTQNPKPRFSLLDDMYVERGTKEDWEALKDLHYKTDGGVTGPHYFRCVNGQGDLVGVVVTCAVSLLLGARHEVFPKLKPGKDTKLTNTHRANWLNANMRRCARIVNHTLYRGVGVGYRMVNLAMRMEGLRYMEIQSSMAKYNPFDVKAGFVHGNLRESPLYEKGLAFFRRWFSSHPNDLMSLVEELDAMPPKLKTRVSEEIRAFYIKHSAKEKIGTGNEQRYKRVADFPMAYVIKELQQLIFATPAYGIWENPDLGRKLPDRLPLSAFDLQGAKEPLRLDLL